jgi:diguanylate cyclase (GGDEF)-like protein/PAS domain S-box-containing protein
VLLLINVIGAILPESNQPLIWYVPVLDCATVVTLVVIVVLASADVVLRRDARLLPAALSSLALALVWLAHGLTFPQVLPSSLPFVSSQTAAYLFQLGHIGASVLLAWILLQPTQVLQRPRLTLIKLLATTAAATVAAIVLLAALSLMLPPLVLAGRFTALNGVLQAVPAAAIVAVGVAYGRRRRPERRLESALLVAMVLLAVEAMTFLFMRSRYDGYWYLGHGLLVLPYGALFVGVVRVFAAARREAEVQQSVVRTLQESQRRLQVIVDTSPSAVISANQDGVITGWNRKAEEMFGWSRDEALGRTLTGTVIPRRYHEAHRRGLERFVATGEGRLAGRTVELSAVHRDGHEFPIEISISATSRSGANVSFVAFITDMTQRRSAERTRAVQFAVTRPLANAASWEDAAPQLLQGMCESLGCVAAEFWSVDEATRSLRRQHAWYRPTRDLASFQASTAELAISRGVGLVGRVWSTGRARALDALADEASPWAELAVRAGLHTVLAFPVTNGRKVTGVVAVLSQHRKLSDRSMLRVTSDIGSQIGHFIERRKAEEELRRSGDRIRAILDNVADGIITVDERLVVRSFNPAAERLFGYEASEVLANEFARFIAESQWPEVKPLLRGALRAQNHDDPMGRHETRGLRKDGTEFPLEFNVSRLGPQRLVIGSLRDVSEQRAETEALQYQALHDPLTGLPNRTLLQERLRETLRAGEREMKPSAVLLLDLDGFKRVNDSLGHQAGDRLLQQVSNRMRAVLRKADTVARYGGDEFAIVPFGATDGTRALLIAEKILQALDKPFTIEEQAVSVTASIGIAVFPEHAEDADALIRRADVAMYAAKRAQSGYSVYSVDQEGGENVGKTPLIGKLRYAIDQFELLLHYQPIVSTSDGKPIKVEALVRWGHPSHGLLPPDDFIPSAEQTDLIKPLTQWVLNEAIGQVHAWSKAGIDIGVAVNLSARNLLDNELPDAVGQLLQTWQVPPEKLTLELTESVIVAPEAVETLQRLQAIGVGIAVDDFGTGYSSLAYLKWLPISEIKIDRSFVRDMATNHDGAAIVQSTIDLGHNLGLKVVAEGVEDQRTADLLRDYRCEYIQGFHISKPTAAATLGPWLRSQLGLNGVVHGSLSA